MPNLVHMALSMTAAVLGMLLNGYIVLVLLWQRRVRTANNLLLLHLAFVDILFCILLLSYCPVLVLDLPSPEQVCAGHGFFWTVLPAVIVWTVCGISCERYAAISRPLQYSNYINTRRASAFVGATWLMAMVIALPPIVGVCQYSYRDDRWACVPQCSGDPFEVFFMSTYASLSMLIPVFFILIVNLHIFLIARYHRHRIATAIYEVTLRAQATVTLQKNPCYLNKYRGRNAVATIGHYVVTLIVFSVPYYVVLLWEAAEGQRGHPGVVSAVTVLFTCTPLLNAYVYGVKSPVLRQTFMRILRRRLFKREASKEVERRLSSVSNRTHRTSSFSRKWSLSVGSSMASDKSTSWLDFRRESRKQSVFCITPPSLPIASDR